MSSRSNSASAAKMPNTSLPNAVVVSMAALMPGQDLQTDPALGEIVDQVNELPGRGRPSLDVPMSFTAGRAKRLANVPTVSIVCTTHTGDQRDQPSFARGMGSFSWIDG